MNDGNARTVCCLVVGAVFVGGSGCSAPDLETASLGAAEQALTLPPLAPLPTFPLGRLVVEGTLSSSELNQYSCDMLRADMGIPNGSSPGTVDVAALDSMKPYSCDGFKNTFLGGKNYGKAEIGSSVKIAAGCSFQNVEFQITKSNVQLHCGDNTFYGGDTLIDGLTLEKNSEGNGPSADFIPTLETIRNVHISHCKFENYKRSGVYISNKFNRDNTQDQGIYDGILGTTPVEPWDSLHAPSAADSLRQRSPSGIYLGDISVKNTGNAAIYLHDHVQNIDINSLHARDTRLGVYIDHGSRFNTVRNSCFQQQKIPDGDISRTREFIAVDSSAGNTIKSNLFHQNVQSAVRLYKNCSESVQKPDQFFRRQSANENSISSNVIIGPSNPQSNYAGISIASRQWHVVEEDEYYTGELASPPLFAKVQTCGDAPVARGSNGEYIYRDYAQDNLVVSNVFVSPGLGVNVRDDRNLVYGNRFYDPANHPGILAVRVGTNTDLTYGGRSFRDNWLKANYVDPYVTPPPQSIPEGLFDFRDESMEYSAFQGNRFEGTAVCRSPFYVPSSNVAGEFCRYGSSDEPTLYVQGTIEHFFDSGRIHGGGDVQCTTNGWLMKPGAYCCSGDGCTPTSLAGKYFN